MWIRLFGLLIFAMGTFMVIKTEWMLNGFGRIAWFEEKLGYEGGSRLGYKIVGMLGIFLGALMIFGLFNGFAEWILGPLIRAGRMQ